MKTTDEPQAVLVATLGTTAEPVERAMEGVRGVFVIYGRPYPGQPNDPVGQLLRLRQRAEERGIGFYPQEAPDPEDLEGALRICRGALRAAAAQRPAQVIADFTGGTKVMSAALCHAALSTPLEVPVQPQYIGGEQRGEGGRVLTEAMRPRPQVEALLAEARAAVLDQLRQFNYAGAEALAMPLSPLGRNHFVQGAAAALRLWDRFEYGSAADRLRRGSLGGGMAGAFGDDAELGPLADTLSRLHLAAQPMIDAVKFLRGIDGAAAWRADDVPGHQEGMVLLVADALENAARRAFEERHADAVLRCYRAVETAVQVALLADGINPWGEPRIVLNEGYQRVAPKAGLPVDPEEQLRDLQQTRNYSFLEHGYREVKEEQARRALTTADEVAAALLAWAAPARSLAEARSRVRHRA